MLNGERGGGWGKKIRKKMEPKKVHVRKRASHNFSKGDENIARNLLEVIIFCDHFLRRNCNNPRT